MKNIIKFLLSFLFDIRIEKTSTAHNPILEVIYRNGKNILNAKKANYSFGDLHTVFQLAFKQVSIKKHEIKEVLILGYGAGSVATILQHELAINCNITGIEADSKVIELSKKHFQNQLKNVELINARAEEFIFKTSTKFDLIVIDVFSDLQVPQAIQDESFIKQLPNLVNLNGIVLYNFVLHSKESKKQLETLEATCATYFYSVDVLKILDFNRVLVLRK